MIANGIFMSERIYLMPVWAGCENYQIQALQSIQNNVATSVTKKDRFTSTKTLMKECGWLTVKQLMAYHSIVQLHKTNQSQKPAYLYKRISSELDHLARRTYYNYKTRQQARGELRLLPELEAKLDVSKKSWCWKASSDYFNLPVNIKRAAKIKTFKSMLKTWLKETIES